jgi:hypothetical protein
MNSFILFDKPWKKYKLDALFAFYKGKRLIKKNMAEGDTNFIASIDDNNGIRNKIDLPPDHEGNCITVNYNGSEGDAFYQDMPFLASADVNVLYPKNWRLNRNIGIFLATVIRFNKYRFGYGRKWTLDKMKETFVALPCNADGLPAWEFMNEYIESLTDMSKIATSIKKENMPLVISKWKVFYLTDIFDIRKIL